MLGPVLMLAAATSVPGRAYEIGHAVASAPAAVPDGGVIGGRRSAGCEQAALSLVAETSLPPGTRVARLRSPNLRIDFQKLQERQASCTIAETSFRMEDPPKISRIVARISHRLARRSYGSARLIADVNGVTGIAVATDPFGDGVLALSVPTERIGADRRLSIALTLQAECSEQCPIAAEVQEVALVAHESTATSAAHELSNERQPGSTGQFLVEAKKLVRRSPRTVPSKTPAAAKARREAPAAARVVLATFSMPVLVQKPVAVVARPLVAQIYDLYPAAKAFDGKWRARGKAAVIAIDKFEASPSSGALPSEAGQDVNLFLPLRDKVMLANLKTQVTFVWSVRKENRADGQVEFLVNGRRARAVIRASSGSMVAQRLSLAVPATDVRSGKGLSIKAWIRARRGTKRSVNILSVDAMEIEAIP
ncbi:hypothetical protein [Sphingomonas sp. SAFR-052]|uniref:hypothetical protein n=1 Tax=Sphingomonas sp. SAFR-052 TaxID=3436867 RepID=UPI003F7F71B0